jgi:hypothetical protein
VIGLVEGADADHCWLFAMSCAAPQGLDDAEQGQSAVMLCEACLVVVACAMTMGAACGILELD